MKGDKMINMFFQFRNLYFLCYVKKEGIYQQCFGFLLANAT